MKHVKILIGLIILLSVNKIQGQEFYFGNDLSYVNQMEDCGAVYKENNVEKDVYQIFSDHGTNLVRVRLWVDPSWWQAPLEQPAGVKPYYNDLVDVSETIRRSKEQGMQVMLGIQYSDFWADPGRQLIPGGWLNSAYEEQALKDSVYAYTYRILSKLNEEGLMPEFVKIGNENNGGILKHIPEENGYEIAATVSNSWSRHAIMYNAAIQAVRDISEVTEIKPEIAVHFSGYLNTQYWSFNNLISHGVTDFDIMGISYYYAWHQGSLNELESTIRSLKESFPQYEPMVVETGYLWSTKNFDQLGNIITTPDPDYLPVSPEKQLEYMVDYTRAVKRGGGIGVIFWEPAWVSTPCRTPWGVGSSHDHVVFFDPVNTNFMENGGGMWMDSPYYTDLDTWKITFKVDMTGMDVSRGVYITGSFTGETWNLIPMTDEGEGIYSYYTYLPRGSEGGYYFLNGPDWNSKEILPPDCKVFQDSCRKYILEEDFQEYELVWGECMATAPDSVQVTFAVDMTGEDISRGVYITGDPTGDPWSIVQLSELAEGIFSWTTFLNPGDVGAYYYLTTDTWDNYEVFRETVPIDCADWWNSDRGYTIANQDTIIAVKWGSCEEFEVTASDPIGPEYGISIFPNPFANSFSVRIPGNSMNTRIRILDIYGRILWEQQFSADLTEIPIDPGHFKDGSYLLLVETGNSVYRNIIIKQNP